MIGILMFLSALIVLALGYPVAFSFGAVAILFGIISAVYEAILDNGNFIDSIDIFLDMFKFMPYRIYSIMENKLLIAVPLFVFMGVILEKSQLAQRLLSSMGFLFGSIRGGVAVSTVFVGALLAASTGVVGASVVAMGMISLPVMLKYKYNKSLACGTICASGTLGQIIPPSIVLIILGDVFNVPVGELFHKALLPGCVLVGAYIIYILIISFIKPDYAPAITNDIGISYKKQLLNALKSVIPPLFLIVCVLGSIFSGIATPTESSAIGCIGAVILSMFYRTMNLNILIQALIQSIKTTAMIFTILIGATAFSLVFSYSGGDEVVADFMSILPGEKWGFLIFSMILIFVLGFFIDFVEISYIVLPILAPIAMDLGINIVYFAILIAMNLQTSFLTPPFGFSLFFLRGVAPAQIKTSQIYSGVLPFILIQILVLIWFTYLLMK